MPKQNLNGVLYPPEQPILSINNRLTRYNDGVFTAMRYEKGNIAHLAAHISHLYEAATYIGLQPFAPFEPASAWRNVPISFWKESIDSLFEASDDSETAYRVRLYFFRSGGGFFTPLSDIAEYCITAEAINAPVHATISIGFCKETYIAPHGNPAFSNLKMPNYLPYILANRFRKTYNWDEVILLNSKDEVIEGGSSNVLIYAENTLFYTDHARFGGYNGVTQTLIIGEIAPKLGIPTQKLCIHKSILPSVEAILLSNGVSGVRALTHLYDAENVLLRKFEPCAKVEEIKAAFDLF